MSEGAREAFKKSVQSVLAAHSDPIDQSGHTIVSLLQQASSTVKDHCEQTLGTVQKLSGQLLDVENRIKELEQEARYYGERAARAEKWLTHISKEIEGRFFDGSATRQG